MKYCPECNTKYESGNFCLQCGSALENEKTDSNLDISLDIDATEAENLDYLESLARGCEDNVSESALELFAYEKYHNGKYRITNLLDEKEMMVNVPSGVETIGTKAFANSDVIEVTLPEGLIKIEDGAFSGCTDLERINLPSTLRIIGDEAFYGCSSLEIAPPYGVKIGENAFLGTLLFNDDEEESVCSAADGYTEYQTYLEKDLEPYSYVYNTIYDEYGNGVRAEYTLNSLADKSITEAYIPTFVTKIDAIFWENQTIKSVIFENETTKIADGTFNGCTSLEMVELPSALERISDAMFYNCERLSEINIPSTVRIIERVGFCGCRSLRSVDLPSELRFIDDWAFLKCEDIREIRIPEKVRLIGFGAFCDCRSLEEAYIPDSVWFIGERAFDGCTSLKKLRAPEWLHARIRECALDASVKDSIEITV